ncbi:MAG TPA: hypothetical protein DIU09_02850 [Hyphomonadaceae bacterium]|nr:hypothetical protein AEM38_04055 [Hyphomonadaceae bacterium UKL13-1]HCP63509.1 hypothetical protein [Hyphomonadaceae bacterium]
MPAIAVSNIDYSQLLEGIKQVSELGAFQVVLGAVISIVTTGVIDRLKQKKEDRAIRISILNKYSHCADLILKLFNHYVSHYKELVDQGAMVTPLNFPHLNGASAERLKLEIDELRYLYDLKAKDDTKDGYEVADILKDLFSAHNMVVDFNEKYSQVRNTITRHSLSFDKGELFSRESHFEATREQLIPVKVELIEGIDYIYTLIGIGQRSVAIIFENEKNMATLINRGKNPFFQKDLGKEIEESIKTKLVWLSTPQSKFSNPFA